MYLFQNLDIHTQYRSIFKKICFKKSFQKTSYNKLFLERNFPSGRYITI